jgi:hypothetical protein
MIVIPAPIRHPGSRDPCYRIELVDKWIPAFAWLSPG